MSQYIAVGAVPGVFSRMIPTLSTQLAKAGVKVSTGPTGTTVTPVQEGFVSKYKWYLLGTMALAGGVIYLKRRGRKKGRKR
jgi:hypothetical protein